MPRPLLDAQTELLEYLTSGAAIFGDNRSSTSPPAGFDRALLDLEARFSHHKRLAKIRAIFERTFAILAAPGERLVRDFAEAHPPASIGRLDNARQFYRFLLARWEHQPAKPPHLPDVAACEMALAEVAAGTAPAAPHRKPDMPRPGAVIRRATGAALLRCAYVVRPILEGRPHDVTPEQRETLLAVAVPNGSDRPQVFELSPAVFELLASLDDGADAALFRATSELEQLVGELAECGLVEVRA